MKKILFSAAIMMASTAPLQAFYTECTVQKDTAAANRPSGNTEPRWPLFENGQKVAIRDIYRDWVFVTRVDNDRYEYGWIPRDVLRNCQRRDGTP